VLWIALHLPLLSLESFAATLLDDAGDRDAHGLQGPGNIHPDIRSGIRSSAPKNTRPLALMDTQDIVSANAAARALGIKAGIKRATALALAPELVLGQADAARDAQTLMAVAHAALAFTPNVVIQPASDSASLADAAPHTVLLEVQASLRYFGGLPALLKRLRAAVAPLGHRLNVASASTALGAALLARVHADLQCADLAATRRALHAAPVWLIGPGREHWEALQNMGLRTLDDLQRMPRDGLARRFGEIVLSELDRAMGRQPDPRVPLVLPPAFDSRLELFARADTTEQLMHGASMLLARLVAWLSAQHAFVRRFTLAMQHEKRSRRVIETAMQSADGPVSNVTTLDIALAEPSRDSAHLLMLLRERFAQLQLPAPTLELSIHAEDIARRAPPNTELFPTPRSEQEGLTRLVERLQARLGPEQVLRLVQVRDHRPERASVLRTADARMKPPRARNSGGTAIPIGDAAESLQGVRPVWLLQRPEPLRERQGNPVVDGQPLQLLSGPERIEAGWWDADLVERDYFIAQLPGGALVWIYRARLPQASAQESEQGWFLQGRFG
jgi:protein ImuB